ncbi:DUF1178 family protein [Xanthobacter pseudotagetidis]|uniref:DUF1178 family protein n=1 Tax=Xanthobacter pseudotagetidis TaxID=3119911 RepID=UPI00372C7969
MIRYTLNCTCGHAFESWFPSSASYDSQRARGLVTCPSCNATTVEKAVMAPAVARTDKPGRDAPQAAAAPAEPARDSATPMALMGRPEGELADLLRRLRDHVVSNADYVGADFADLARKMHDGELEHRSIYGEATTDEVKALREDEVEVFPLPVVPEDRN